MRTFLLFLSLVSVFVASAQQWCPPGAVWTYHYDGWGVDYRSEYRYLSDTVIEGRMAHKSLLTMEGIGSWGSPISNTGFEYTAAEDGVVWSWNNTIGQVGWDTLYWFGAEVGDRWWPVGHPQNCPPHGMIEVVAVGDSIIQGITLATLSVVIIDENSEPISNPWSIIERIGMTPRDPFIDDCELIIEYYFPHFVCYSDNEIQVPEGGDCFLTLGVSDGASNSMALSIHPNPGSTFQLTGFGERPALLRLLDIQGRTLLNGILATDHMPVDMGDLPPGTYLVEVRTDDGQHRMLRWLKE